MLLHEQPRSVFVLGTGAGMTLGSTSIHPGVERIVLAEIEPGVLGAARTFADENHHVLDDPRLQVVLDDGRNYLARTRERFDVISADPVHPWMAGASSLYTTAYFQSVADHLKPGGVACQWLPMYELTPADVKTVVKTFSASFRHVMVWLSYYDAELVGSNSPITIDEAKLAARIRHPAIARDLGAVQMGSAEDLLSWFVLGTDGARAFGEDGVLNTDDNLHLEFSAPRGIGRGGLVAQTVEALTRGRESLLPYLVPASTEEGRAEQRERWERNRAAARLYDRAHALLLRERLGGPFRQAMAALAADSPRYAPYLFLKAEHAAAGE